MSETKRVMNPPIILKLRRKKKKRSASKKGLGKSERHLTKAADLSVKAAGEGMDAYRKARRKAARKRRDGAVDSLGPNLLKATAAAARHMAVVPVELLRAGNTRPARRLFRSTLRASARTADNIIR